MSIQASCTFAIQVVGDGVSTSFTFDLNHNPVFTYVAGNATLPLKLVSFTPISVQNVVDSGGALTVAASVSGNNLLLSFSPAPTNGKVYHLEGTFLF